MYPPVKFRDHNAGNENSDGLIQCFYIRDKLLYGVQKMDQDVRIQDEIEHVRRRRL